MEFTIETNPTPAPDDHVATALAEPGFCRHFTDHMVTIRWTAGQGWHDAAVHAYRPFTLDPATNFLHYAQGIFEGFKAYTQPDGSIATFRPFKNAERFNRSARRLSLPELPVDDFVRASDLLIRADARWVPTGSEASLYIRPFMFASEVGLGVRPTSDATFVVIAAPAGSYFAAGAKQVSIWVTDRYTRAAPGGMGAAKTAGNYAASLVAQQEALENGCEQVLFLDAVEKRWIEEFGGMNAWVVYDDGSLATPPVSGSILEGVTRDAILTLARESGRKAEERPIDFAEVSKEIRAGRVTEVFACGTAAVVSSVGRLAWTGGEATLPEETPVATDIRKSLIAIQKGLAPDPHGWLHTVSQ